VADPLDPAAVEREAVVRKRAWKVEELTRQFWEVAGPKYLRQFSGPVRFYWGYREQYPHELQTLTKLAEIAFDHLKDRPDDR
jgi:hypothetical protein